jgi:hypothetical protein
VNVTLSNNPICVGIVDVRFTFGSEIELLQLITTDKPIFDDSATQQLQSY